jgi:hypothetical protein
VRRAVRQPSPPRTRLTRARVDRSAARSHLIEAFYVAEAKAQLGRQAGTPNDPRSTR